MRWRVRQRRPSMRSWGWRRRRRMLHCLRRKPVREAQMATTPGVRARWRPRLGSLQRSPSAVGRPRPRGPGPRAASPCGGLCRRCGARGRSPGGTASECPSPTTMAAAPRLEGAAAVSQRQGTGAHGATSHHCWTVPPMRRRPLLRRQWPRLPSRRLQCSRWPRPRPTRSRRRRSPWHMRPRLRRRLPRVRPSRQWHQLPPHQLRGGGGPTRAGHGSGAACTATRRAAPRLQLASRTPHTTWKAASGVDAWSSA
mmetsp:Transcript_80948/g.203682  ORF Transcript_80948/g.203682 Transcript_80948/m.203682 type:complete len:254 (-) Transcript_80948:9-770(-)